VEIVAKKLIELFRFGSSSLVGILGDKVFACLTVISDTVALLLLAVL